jgi:hypothetical protein
MPKYPYLTATKRQLRLGTLWWLIHHQEMIEPLCQPIQVRVEFIRTEKAAHEIPTRLKSMRPVRGTLPVTLVRAALARARTRAKSDLAEARYIAIEGRWGISVRTDRARVAANRAYRASIASAQAWSRAALRFAPAIRRLFQTECADVLWLDSSGLVFPESGHEADRG